MKTSTRVQLAQELHDGIAQDLVGVGYSIDTILATPDTPLSIREELRTLRFDVTDLLEKLRTEIYSLRSDSAHLHLEENVRAIAGELLRTCEIEVIELSSDDSQNISRVALELVRNSVAHSRATHIDIKLWQINDVVMLEVADNGVGGASLKPERYGVTGLYERASQLGGDLEIKSDRDGTRATLRIAR